VVSDVYDTCRVSGKCEMGFKRSILIGTWEIRSQDFRRMENFSKETCFQVYEK